MVELELELLLFANNPFSGGVISPFLDNPIYANDGSFMSSKRDEEESGKKVVTILKKDPPFVHSKQLYCSTPHLDKPEHV